MMSASGQIGSTTESGNEASAAERVQDSHCPKVAAATNAGNRVSVSLSVPKLPPVEPTKSSPLEPRDENLLSADLKK